MTKENIESFPEKSSVHPIKWIPKSDDLDAVKFDKNNNNHVNDDLLDVESTTQNASQMFNKTDTNANEVNSERKNKFRCIILKYSKLVVPPRQQDEDIIDSNIEGSVQFCPPPLIIITFSVIQIIVFFIAVCYNKSNENATTSIYDISDNNTVFSLLAYDPEKRYEVWRFLSYMLVHSNKCHIVSNLIIQIVLGVPHELVNRSWRVALVYLAGVLSACLGHSLLSSNGLCGSSGGVYSLVVAHISTVIMNWNEMYHPSFQLTFLLLWCGADSYYSVYDFFGENNKVSYAAHLFGSFAGLLVGIGVLYNIKPRHWEMQLWWCAVTTFIVFLIIGSIINILVVMNIVRI